MNLTLADAMAMGLSMKRVNGSWRVLHNGAFRRGHRDPKRALGILRMLAQIIQTDGHPPLKLA